MVTINTPRELGQKYRKGFVLSREIAGVRAIPESFVERILLTLRNGGVIVSVRGVKEGDVPYIKIFYNS